MRGRRVREPRPGKDRSRTPVHLLLAVVPTERGANDCPRRTRRRDRSRTDDRERSPRRSHLERSAASRNAHRHRRRRARSAFGRPPRRSDQRTHRSRQCPRLLNRKTARMRNASRPLDREGFSCAVCGRAVITRIEGLFSNPRGGSPRRFCSPACRVAAHRRRQAGVPENTPLQRLGGRKRRLGTTEEVKREQSVQRQLTERSSGESR